MAIQSNMNLMGVNYSDANALWKQAVDQLANAGEKTRKQVNINQEKFDNNVLGFVNQLANKHGVDTPEFEQGMQQILAQNPNNNLDMGTILANAMKSRGDNLGLQKAGLENQITQGGIDDAKIINSVAHLIAKRNRTPEEEAQVQQAYNSVNVTNLLEPTLKTRQLNDDYTLKGLDLSFRGMASGEQGAGVFYDQPVSQLTGGTADIDLLAGYTNPGYGGGYGGSGGGTGGLFPSAPTAQTQTSGNAGGARVPDAYARYVNQASQKYGVHSTLIAAVMKTESGFKSNAVSSAGAQGLMQLMPGTAKDLGVSNPFDPGQNIEGGAKYLGTLLKKYKGNTGHALMAYNWGPGNVDKYLAGKAKPPKETLDYVRKVTANLREGTAATLATKSGGTAAPQGGGNYVYNPKSLSPKYETKLQGTDPRIAEVVSQAAANLGISLGVSEGMRDKATQEKYVKQGKSQTRNSKHLHGGAVDFHIVGKDGKANWDFNAYKPLAAEAKRIAAAKGYEGFEWGGDWKTLKDGVHFQFKEGYSKIPGSSGGGTQPLSATEYMGGLSLQDALTRLGPAPERPANIAPDYSAFNLIMEQLGLDKDDPIVGMYKQFVDLGAKRGKQKVDYQQSYMDYNQHKQDRTNLENHYVKTLVSNKLKVDSSTAKAMQDEAKVNEVRQMFQGGLVGTMGEDMAKEFVEFIKNDMQLTKDDFYNASPAEQMTILEDYLKTYSSYAAKSSNIQTKKDLDGAVPFNNIGKLAISVANNLTAKETADSPQDADKFKAAQNKNNFVATAINNTLASVQKNQNKQAIDTLNYGLNPQNMQQVYTNSIAQFNAKKQKENIKKPWYSTSTVGFNKEYQLTKEEQEELQAIVAANMYAVADQYNKKSQAPLTQEENKNLNTNRYDAMLNFVKQLKK